MFQGTKQSLRKKDNEQIRLKKIIIGRLSHFKMKLGNWTIKER